MIIALMNLPSPEMIDGRLEMLADYWVNVEIGGRTRIYKKKINRIKRVVYYETLQVLELVNFQLSTGFECLPAVVGQVVTVCPLVDHPLRNKALINQIIKVRICAFHETTLFDAQKGHIGAFDFVSRTGTHHLLPISGLIFDGCDVVVCIGTPQSRGNDIRHSSELLEIGHDRIRARDIV